MVNGGGGKMLTKRGEYAYNGIRKIVRRGGKYNAL